VTIRTADQSDIVAVLTDLHKDLYPTGVARKKVMSQSSLVPGLWVKLQGVGSSPGDVRAAVISFSGRDLWIANAIHAGVVPLEGRAKANTAGIQANQEQIQANRQEIRTNRQDIEQNRQSLQQCNQRFQIWAIMT
jgi:hypothetical protein